MTPRPQYEAPAYRGSAKLKDKVALITGGDSGIGRAVAVLFAREGANIAIVYMQEEQADAEETRAAVEREGGKCLLLPGDVRRAAFCRQTVTKTVRRLGRLDSLIVKAIRPRALRHALDTIKSEYPCLSKIAAVSIVGSVKRTLSRPRTPKGSELVKC